MGFVKAKCLNCGANLNVDNNLKTGVCAHCGASYITEDVIVNNITNIYYSETINGVSLKRQAVLEKMLIEYYLGKFNDVDNMKEYALKVQEYDINNVLAHFVVFDNIDSIVSMQKLLGDENLNISLQLFIVLLNTILDDLNKEEIINNIIKYKSQIDGYTIVKEIIKNCKKKDLQFIFNTIYHLQLTESENNALLDVLYNEEKTNKITFLSQLKIFTLKHNDFMYNEKKFDEYADYWKSLKEKQIAKRQVSIENEIKKEQEYKDNVINIKTLKSNKKRKTWLWIFIAVILFIIFVLCLL